MSQATTNPYLTFNGNCKEAMTFYNEALNGKLELMPFEGSPMDVPNNHKEKIMHSSVSFGNSIIMASDSMPDQKVDPGDAVAISIASKDENEATEFFQKLSSGGTVIMPFDKTFWGAKFGMFIDKFGFRWMINCELPQE